MSFRLPALALLVLSLSLSAGCSKKRPPAPPPPPPEQPKPKEEPKQEEPKPEPKSDGPVQLALPEKPLAEPWVVGGAAEPVESNAVHIPEVAPLSVTGLAVRPGLGRAVFTCRTVAKKGGPLTTRLVLCDSAAGRILSEWQIPGEYTVLDLSPDGRSILATAPGTGKGRETLRVWLVTSDGKIKRWSIEPHALPAAGPPVTDSGRQLTAAEAVAVRWAAFVGNDRVVSVSWAGQVRVWNPDGPKLLATIDSTPCRPAVTPDGTRVAFLAGESVALLDPAACRVTDVRRVGPPPAYPVLAFSPDGSRLAVGGNQEAAILDLATGAVRHAALPKLRVTDNGVYDRPFAWAGKDYLHADQQLHHPDFPLPVWEYRGAEMVQVRGWQAWVSVRGLGNSSVLRAVTLPHADLRARIDGAKASPGRFALKPGDRVRIDTTGVPADRQAAVRAALEGRLKELGYAPDEAGSATLLASVDGVGVKAEVTYVARTPVPYVRRPAKLQLVQNGKELWSDAWSVPPPLVPRPEGKETVEQCLTRCGAGDPNYDLFKDAAIPTHFPAPGLPAVALGTSEFTADGFRDSVARKE